MKVGDIVRVDPDFYESNVVTKDYLADCVITKLERVFLDDGGVRIATIERCDEKAFHYIAYDGQKIPNETKDLCVWESGFELIEERRF